MAHAVELLLDDLADRVAVRLAARLPAAEAQVPAQSAQATYLTVKQACERCAVSDDLLRRAIALRELAYTRIARRAIRIAVADLDRWLESRTLPARRI